MNATPSNNLTPEQSLQLLTELAALPTLKLNLQEHQSVQAALHTLRELVESLKPQPAE